MTETAIHADDAPTRPALLTLLHDQRVLLDGDDPRVEYGLRDGFPTRRSAIAWYQRATVRTLGYIADAWSPVDLARDRVLITALVTGPDRRTYVKSDDRLLDAASGRDYRDRLERNLVLPAAHRAYNDLRRRSGEYIETQDDPDGDDVSPADIDPSGQDHVAMRPGFQQADDRQCRALERLWGGFSDDHALMDWLHDLNAATNGAVDEDLPAMTGRDSVAREFLLEDVADPSHARRYRERFAVHTLLPAFVRSIKRMSAGELAQQSREGLTFAQG